MDPDQPASEALYQKLADLDTHGFPINLKEGAMWSEEVSNSLNTDQDRHSVGDLGPSCLQRLSDDKSHK